MDLKRIESHDQRVKWIDVMKGVSIFCVVLSHVDFTPLIYRNFFSPFFLISFLFASGFTHNIKRSIKDQCLRRVKTLLLPFLILGAINILLTQVITFSKQLPIGIQFKYMMLQIREREDILWFLPALFVIDISYHLICKIPNLIVRHIFIVFLAVSGIIYSRMGGDPMPWHMEMIGIGCLWMDLGSIYRGLEHKIHQNSYIRDFAIATIVYILIIVICNNTFGYQYINFYHYGRNILVYVLESLTGMLWILSFSYLFKDSRVINFLGRNSLLYFALHGKAESLTMWLLYKTDIIGYVTNNYVLSILCTVFEILLLVIPICIINHLLCILRQEIKKNGKCKAAS